MSAPEPGARTHVCLYSHHVGQYWSASPGRIGGAEVQLARLGEALARRGDFRVTVLCADPGEVDLPPGLDMACLPAPARGRWGTLNYLRTAAKTIARIDADVYMQRSAGVMAFVLARHSRRTGARFIYQWASDADARGGTMPGWLARRLFVYGRRRAHRQVCQSDAQAELARATARDRGPDTSKRAAEVVPNALDDSLAWGGGRGTGVLWCGAPGRSVKRADRLLEVAAAMPEVEFRVAGPWGPGDVAPPAALRETANITLLGLVPRTDMPATYRKAAVLLNTSDVEGMPNTFLEAWASNVPVASLTVDPTGDLASGRGGLLAHETAALPQAIRHLMTSPPPDLPSLARRFDGAAQATHMARIFHEEASLR